MKITGTRSYIIVEFDHRSVKIQGELTLTPAFYAIKNSIKNWESPYEHIAVTGQEKEDIVRRVEMEKGAKVRIIFEDEKDGRRGDRTGSTFDKKII